MEKSSVSTIHYSQQLLSFLKHTEPNVFLYIAAARQLHPPYFTVRGFLIEDLQQHVITFIGWSKGKIPLVRLGYHHRISGVPAQSLLEVFGQELTNVFFLFFVFLHYGTDPVNK